MNNHLQKPLEKIASEIRNASTRSIDKLSRNISDLSAIQSVELLTDDEINELRTLVNLNGQEEVDYVAERMKDDALKGLYLQLSRLGFVRCIEVLGPPHIVYDGYTPKAHWAISRRDLRIKEDAIKKEAAENIRKQDRKYDTRNIVIGWFIGILTAYAPQIIEIVRSMIS